MAWLSFIHRNADLLLLISIVSLGLLPLMSIYLLETEQLDAPASSETPEVLRSFFRLLVYLSIVFPYLLALLSTYISVQLVRHQQRFQPSGTSTIIRESNGLNNLFFKATSFCKGTSFSKTYPNTKVLKKEDMVSPEGDNKGQPQKWKIPSPGDKATTQTTRLVEEDCIICMHPYQVGDRIVWSSNPKCIHCYHHDCLRAWMEPHDPKARRCPCCRQSFFVECSSCSGS